MWCGVELHCARHHCSRASTGSLWSVFTLSIHGCRVAGCGSCVGALTGHAAAAAAAAAAVLAVSGLSSPHLKTTSASEPPRSVVLLGKRGLEYDAGDNDTPASSLRSVRQRLDNTTGWRCCFISNVLRCSRP
jgi:hypothetical protein